MARHAEFNQADVAAAVSLYLGVDPSRSEIRAIASRINLQGLHVPAGTSLSQSGDFRSRVLAVGGADLEQLVSSHRLIQLQLEQERANAVRVEGRRAGSFEYGGALSSAADDSGSEVSSGNAYWGSPRGRAEMAAYARHHGVGWMANHPDLLRLGPTAIELFARTNFQRETYTGLREVGMEARQIERLVRRAEESGQDANEVGRVTRDSIRAFGGGTLQGQREMARMFDDFHANPADDRAWGTVHETLRHFETHGTPEQQAQSRRQREISERIRNTRLQASADVGQANAEAGQATNVTAQATTAVAALSTATAAVDDLYGTPPSTGPAVVVRDGANDPPSASPPPSAVPPPSQPPARLGG